MNTHLDETHDPALRSWIPGADDPETDYPVQALPLARARLRDGSVRVGVPVGSRFVLPGEILSAGLLPGIADELEPCFADGADLSLLAARPAPVRRTLRLALSRLLREGGSALRESAALVERAVVPIDACTLLLPVEHIGDYTDFYASVHHATNVGSMFRPDNPLLPNYKHVPIGYHGRASSIVASGTRVRRPRGQQSPPENVPGAGPSFGASKMLDYELEVGAFLGPGNALGEPIDLHQAEDHIVGLCLVNDWSARDLQKWEYQPLGPFLAKNFATSVSPVVVPLEALAPFRCAGAPRGAQDPSPLPYLADARTFEAGGVDLTLEVYLTSAEMRRRQVPPVRLSRGSFRHMFWTLAQMVAHHAVNGCNLRPGDLIASGTVSGPERDSRGCLLELTWNGDMWSSPPRPAPGSSRTPIDLPTGEKRLFLEDGDEVILRGWAQREGFRRVGLGECRGIIEPAPG